MCNWFKKDPKPIGNKFNLSGYNLIFSEYFNNYGIIDWSKWTNTYPGGQDQKELTKWVKENVTSGYDGLKLITTKGNGVNLCGQICSYPFLNVKYGYISVVAKVPPKGYFYFPAIWMYNLQTGWLPELDIVELAGGASDQLWFTHHWNNNGNPASEGTQLKWYKTDFSQNFHEYSIEWTVDRITWYVDKMPYYTTTNNIPQDELFLICGIQSGGVEGDFKHLFTDSESGGQMIIKSVEIWQK